MSEGILGPSQQLGIYSEARQRHPQCLHEPRLQLLAINRPLSLAPQFNEVLIRHIQPSSWLG